MRLSEGIVPHTPEWVAARLGKITASEMHRVFVKGQSKNNFLSVGALTYVNKKIGEILTQIMSDEVPEVDDIQRGLAGEIFAIERYEELTGVEVYPSMLYSYNAIAAGTTDGCMSEDKKTIKGILEAKAPRAHIHLQCLAVDAPIELKAISPQYWHQPQANLLFTGADYADFVSYNESFKHYDLQVRIIRLYPDMDWRKDFVEIIDWIAEFMGIQLEKILKAPERNLAYRFNKHPEQIEKLQDAITNIKNISI